MSSGGDHLSPVVFSSMTMGKSLESRSRVVLKAFLILLCRDPEIRLNRAEADSVGVGGWSTPGPPWRARVSKPLHPLDRTPGRGRHRSSRWTALEIRTTTPWPSDHRPVQDGVDSPTRTLARPRAGGVRGSPVGPLAQPPPAPRSEREPATGHQRKRRAIANASTRCWPRDSTKTLSGKPGAVQRRLIGGWPFAVNAAHGRGSRSPLSRREQRAGLNRFDAGLPRPNAVKTAPEITCGAGSARSRGRSLSSPSRCATNNSACA